MELTILIPALNEEKTIATCIKKAKKFLEENNIDGEVLIANNNSMDKTEEISIKEGARVVLIKERGYGKALIEGSKEAKGIYTIMGDADDSYDLSNLNDFVEKLREGNDLVIGNRYKGKMEKGAMPFSHKYIGTPIISLTARLLYGIPVGDFNCGLRGYITEKINKLRMCF